MPVKIDAENRNHNLKKVNWQGRVGIVVLTQENTHREKIAALWLLSAAFWSYQIEIAAQSNKDPAILISMHTYTLKYIPTATNIFLAFVMVI